MVSTYKVFKDKTTRKLEPLFAENIDCLSQKSINTTFDLTICHRSMSLQQLETSYRVWEVLEKVRLSLSFLEFLDHFRLFITLPLSLAPHREKNTSDLIGGLDYKKKNFSTRPPKVLWPPKERTKNLKASVNVFLYQIVLACMPNRFSTWEVILIVSKDKVTTSVSVYHDKNNA